MRNDATVTCASCGTASMERGGDTVGWKGVQLTDDPLDLSWYCVKMVCMESMAKSVHERVREMRVAQGLPPDPPRSTKGGRLAGSPVTVGREGSGHTFEPPPGGFSFTEKGEEEDGKTPRRTAK